MRKNIDIRQVLMDLEIDVSEFASIMKQQSFQEAEKKLYEFKIRLKKHKKRMSLKFHPDRGGDEEKMKKINALFDFLEKLKLPPPRPRFQQVTIVFHQNTNTTSATTGTTTASSSYY